MSRKNLADHSTLVFSHVFDFSGRVVLITGAASGIGKATAELFSERGAQLALIDKSPHIESVASALGAGARSWQADIVEDDEVERIVGEVASTFGRIDVLINNAGVGGVWPAEATSSADWSLVISINLTGQYFVAREAAKHMLKAGRGRIVMLASQTALLAWTGMQPTRRRKRVCSGCCDQWRSSGDHAGSPSTPSRRRWSIRKCPPFTGAARRASAPAPKSQSVASPSRGRSTYAAMFLASDAAAMINGANLVVDGGNTIR